MSVRCCHRLVNEPSELGWLHCPCVPRVVPSLWLLAATSGECNKGFLLLSVTVMGGLLASPSKPRAFEAISVSASAHGKPLSPLDAREACAVAASTIGTAVAWFPAYSEALRGRADASVHTTTVYFRDMWVAVDGLARGSTFDLRSCVMAFAKVAEAGVEAAKATAAQLDAHAMMLDALCEGGDLQHASHAEGVPISLLLGYGDALCDATPGLSAILWSWVCIQCAGVPLDPVRARLRTGLSPDATAIAGPLLNGYTRGGDAGARAHNVLDVRLIDDARECIEDARDGDVDGSCVGGDVSVHIEPNGVARVTLVVTADSTGDTELYVRAFGCLVGGFPLRIPVSDRESAFVLCLCAPVATLLWRMTIVCVFCCVQHMFMASSTVLRDFSAEVRQQLNIALASRWLPGKRLGALLYRGSDHGMSALAFHRRCDGAGPTLTLIHAAVVLDGVRERCVVGGFVSTPWDSHSGWKECKDAFIFNARQCEGPPGHGGPSVSLQQWPIMADQHSNAMHCYRIYGPYFGMDIVTLSKDVFFSAAEKPESPFDGQSTFQFGHCYGPPDADSVDPHDVGRWGHHMFTPVDIEVYAVV